MEELLMFLKPLIETYLPKGAESILILVGSLRLFVKPLMGLLEAYTQVSPTKTDDALPDRVTEHKAYIIAVKVLDWLTSIKLKK